MKGILLAGGTGSRLYPITQGVSKHLLPTYDKPMIYYALSVLMLAEIRDILLICTVEDIDAYKRLLGDGKQFGINLSYAIQDKPEGIAQAFIIAENFIGQDNVCMVLGDNIFYGQGFRLMLMAAVNRAHGATLFAYKVRDPERFGVVTFDHNMKVLGIEEKPIKPQSNYAITGLYFYDNDVVDIAKSVSFSHRGEMEITAINNEYLKRGQVSVEVLGRGFAWLDTGTFESMLAASQFVQTVELRQSYKVACLEEIAMNNHWVTPEQVSQRAASMRKNSYGQYLLDLVDTL
ncbi:MAG: glucose-1-phosphate thymidylyltransferase [Paraglaciecola sp.]|jgi:glucose-1-phosphate thymidylyltransferase